MAEDPFQRFEKLDTLFTTTDKIYEPISEYLVGLGIDPGPCIGGILSMPQQMRDFLTLHGALKPFLAARIQTFEASIFGLSMANRAADWRQAIAANRPGLAEVVQTIELLEKTGTPMLQDLPTVLEYLRMLRSEVLGSDELDPDSKKWLLEAIDGLTHGLSRYWYSGPESLQGLVLATALRLDELSNSDKKNPIFQKLAFLVRDLGVNILATGIWTVAALNMSWIPPSPPELSKCFVQQVKVLPAAPEMKELNPGPQKNDAVESTTSSGALSD